MAKAKTKLMKYHEMYLSSYILICSYLFLFCLFFFFQENAPLIDTGKRQIISENSVERKNIDTVK